MPEPLAPALDDIRAQLLSADTLVKGILSGHRPGKKVAWRRIEFRPVALKAGKHLQIVSYDERQAHTRNVAFGAEAAAAVDAILAMDFGNFHVKTTTGATQIRVTRKGEAHIHRDDADTAGQILTHDREKPHLLDPEDPFWRAIGVAANDGAIKPTQRDKFRQVQEFVRELDTVLKPEFVPQTRKLRVVDLGCGNAHLTFAAYRFLTKVRGLDVEFIGVDVKRQARERNAALATLLGWSGLTFIESRIADAPVDQVDVVLALHACDTATDDALARAVAWQAPIVLAAPCCHHDIQRQLKSHPAPEPYTLLTKYGILMERFADTLTDSLRAAILRLLGYRVEVVEFVPSAHTPRNTMLRAVRTGARPRPELVAQYRSLTSQWGVKPYLAELLQLDAGLAPPSDRHGLGTDLP